VCQAERLVPYIWCGQEADVKQEASYQEQMFAILFWHCPLAQFQKSGRGDEDGMQLSGVTQLKYSKNMWNRNVWNCLCASAL